MIGKLVVDINDQTVDPSVKRYTVHAEDASGNDFVTLSYNDLDAAFLHLRIEAARIFHAFRNKGDKYEDLQSQLECDH